MHRQARISCADDLVRGDAFHLQINTTLPINEQIKQNERNITWLITVGGSFGSDSPPCTLPKFKSSKPLTSSGISATIKKKK